MKGKKFLGLILIGVIMGTVGCAEKPQIANTNKVEETKENRVIDNLTAPGELPIVKEKITLSAFVPQNSRIVDLKTNEAVAELEKRTNIHLDLNVVPASIVDEKKQILLVSGNYPEIFLSRFNNEELIKYGAKEKIFIPLNDLIQKYSMEIKNTDAVQNSFTQSITAPDGNIYGIPRINQAYHGSMGEKMWVHHDWLEKLNLTIPQTTEDFYQMLKAFKEQDPNANGQQDEIPLTGAIKTWNAEPEIFLLNAFIYTDKLSYFRNLEGKLDFVANKEEYREGLKYVNKLYKEGLIDPAAFTQDLSQLSELGNSDNDLIGAAAAGHVMMLMSLEREDERAKSFRSIPPLQGPEGVRQTVGGEFDVSGAAFTITDKCKNPEAALRLADYLYSEEGTLLMEYGVEESGWIKAKEGELNIMGEPAKYTQITSYAEEGAAHNKHWDQTGPTRRTSEFGGIRGSFTTSQDIYTPEGYEKRLFDETKENYEPYKSAERLIGSAWLPVERISEVGQLKVNIIEYVNQARVAFITGAKDINNDTEWNNYIKGFDGLNLQGYVDVFATAYGLETTQQ